ncbi:hypothetical protein [Ruminococcus flavefaciens]|uniref:hypothetical protein n=1 Tax=Ruminococcus flavefaciens TaxID=1265 RepID=UPI000464E744|nr:hypothetical protein [Ruminococcus flavefaciens]
MANRDVKTYARKYGIRLWQIADALHISESTMTRLMRKELPANDKAAMFLIIDQLFKQEA